MDTQTPTSRLTATLAAEEANAMRPVPPYPYAELHGTGGPWDRLHKALAQVADLEGTVSGLRAELAATLRRLDAARETGRLARNDADASRRANHAANVALEQVTDERDELRARIVAAQRALEG